MKNILIAKIFFLLLSSTAFIVHAQSARPQLQPKKTSTNQTQAVQTPEPLTTKEAAQTRSSTPDFEALDEIVLMEEAIESIIHEPIPASPAPEAAEAAINQEAITLQALDQSNAQEQPAMNLLELQSLHDLLSKKKHTEIAPLIAGKRILRTAGTAIAAGVIVKIISLIKKDLFTNVSFLGWFARSLALSGICVGGYEASAQLLPENAEIYRSILHQIVSHWNIYQMLIPEEYVDIFKTIHQAHVTNNHILPLTEKESKKIVRAVKYDVKRKMRAQIA